MPPLNQYQVGIALQSAKGAIASAPQYVFDVSAADLGAVKETSRREETGMGIDVGDPMINRIAVGGGFTVYARPSVLGLLLYSVLGAKAVTGAGPYVHAITPADDKPWLTIWSTMFGGGNRITVRYEDCKLTSASLTGEAGQDVMLQAGVAGLRHQKLADGTAMPAGGTYVTDLPIRVPGAVYKKNEVATDAIANFNLTINSAINTAQTNAITDSFAEQGQREMTLSFEEVFTNQETFKKAYYNTDGTPRTAVYNEPMDMTFEDEAGVDRLTVRVEKFGYDTAPLTPNPNGEIARQAVEGWVMRNPGGVALTASVTNSVATYPTAA